MKRKTQDNIDDKELLTMPWGLVKRTSLKDRWIELAYKMADQSVMLNEQLQSPKGFTKKNSEYQKVSATLSVLPANNEAPKEGKLALSSSTQLLSFKALQRKYQEEEKKSKLEKEYYFFEGEKTSTDIESAIKRFGFIYDDSEEELENSNDDSDADTQIIESDSENVQENERYSPSPLQPSSSVVANLACSIKISGNIGLQASHQNSK